MKLECHKTHMYFECVPTHVSLSEINRNNKFDNHSLILRSDGSRYSRMDQVKFVEESL